MDNFWILDVSKQPKPTNIPGTSKWLGSEMAEFSSLTYEETEVFANSVNVHLQWLNDQVNEIINFENNNDNDSEQMNLLLKSPKKSPIKIDFKNYAFEENEEIDNEIEKGKKKSSITINPLYLTSPIAGKIKKIQNEEIKETKDDRKSKPFTPLPSRTPLVVKKIPKESYIQNKLKSPSPSRTTHHHHQQTSSSKNPGFSQYFSTAISRAKSIFKHNDSNSPKKPILKPKTIKPSYSSISSVSTKSTSSSIDSVGPTSSTSSLHSTKTTLPKIREFKIGVSPPRIKPAKADNILVPLKNLNTPTSKEQEKISSPLRNQVSKRLMDNDETNKENTKKRKTNEYSPFKTPIAEQLKKESSIKSIKRNSDLTRLSMKKISLENVSTPKGNLSENMSNSLGFSTPNQPKFNGSQLMKSTLIKNATGIIKTTPKKYSKSPEFIIKKPKTVLPEIYSDDEDEDPDILKSWANSPELKSLLKNQQKIDPDKLFGPIGRLNLEEIFKDQGTRKLGIRSSSARWDDTDKLTFKEIESYKSQMGYSK